MERKKNYYDTITKRLLIAFFCLSIVPIVCFAWIMKDAVEETNVIKLNELAISTIEHRSEVISQFLRDKINMLRVLFSSIPKISFSIRKMWRKLFLAMNNGREISLISRSLMSPEHSMPMSVRIGPRSKVKNTTMPRGFGRP